MKFYLRRVASHVKNEDMLHRDEVESIVLHAIKRKKANRIGHVLLRNCLLKYIMKGKIEGDGKTRKNM